MDKLPMVEDAREMLASENVLGEVDICGVLAEPIPAGDSDEPPAALPKPKRLKNLAPGITGRTYYPGMPKRLRMPKTDADREEAAEWLRQKKARVEQRRENDAKKWGAK